MEVLAAACLVCSKSKVSKELKFLKINFSNGTITEVPEWHSGIRIICNTCISSLKKLNEK